MGILLAMDSSGAAAPRIVALLELVACLAVGLSCSPASTRVERIARQNLFSISIGRMEDQIDLMGTGTGSGARLSLSMRNGIFFISDGQARKVMEFSSYGDILSLMYDPESNPPPVLLSAEGDSGGFRVAKAHPFREIGLLAVSSRQDVYIEDHLPPERRVSGDDGSILDAVILRFAPDGSYLDYIGQEGLGGTPFQNIALLSCSVNDDIVVVSALAEEWLVFWYTREGTLVSSLSIGRNALPVPEGSSLIPSLDGLYPDQDSRLLYLKVDYAKELLDESTGASSGVAYDSSVVWLIDPSTGAVSQSIPVPPAARRSGGAFSDESYLRPWSFIGASAGRNLFFRMPEDDGSQTIMVMNASTAKSRRFGLAAGSEEETAGAYHLGRDGILSALLVGRTAARVVWWRLDRVIGELSR